MRQTVRGGYGNVRGKRRFVRLSAVLILGSGLVVMPGSFAQHLYWLGTLGGNESAAYGVSDNGIVVGMARNAQGQQRAFRWQCDNPMVDLGTLGGARSVAYDISDDGKVIVGSAQTNSSLWQAFKYQGGSMINLGSLVPGGSSAATGVSANGSVIVGYSTASCPGYRYDDQIGGCADATYLLFAACKWDPNITQIGSCYKNICEVPDPGVGLETFASGVSQNGSTWVGWKYYWDVSHASGNGYLALKNGSQVDVAAYLAHAVTGNGDIVVGQGKYMCFHPNYGYYICYPPSRWPGGALTPTNVSDPDAPAPGNGSAYGVTADGSVIVGSYEGRAFRWKITGNNVVSEDLNIVYASLLGNSVLIAAYDISSNGRYIVGVGYNAATQRREAFLLDTRQSCPLCVPYTLVLGDRDLQRGVLTYDPDSDTFGVFGACQSAATRYYYGLDVHPTTGEVWACDILANRIVRLDPNGVCLQTIPMPSGYTGLPTGLAIHPGGRYLHVTNQGNRIDAYDIQTGQWVATTFVNNASGLYGLKWIGGGLYVCDFYGKRLILLTGNPDQPLNELGRITTPYNPYDVTGYSRTGGRAPIDYIYITQTSGFYGSYAEVSTASHAWDTPGYIFGPYTLAQHPGNNNADGGGYVSFFGIEIDPSHCQLWVSDYIRGDLYSVDLASNTATFRGSIEAGYKLGLGIAIRQAPTCTAHNGDVDSDGCVDDADLLAVLFAFGQSGSNLGRVDVNCDTVVDDADLLIVLFNFGRC